MAVNVKLKEITADNWEAVADLELAKDQEDLVADNVYSIAESKFNPHAILKAIYSGRRLVGFIMYEPCIDDGQPHEYLIYRFMIDRRHQGKGYGRAALQRVIDTIKQDPQWKCIRICYMPENKAARKFYGSLGFEEAGIDEDNEIIAEIRRKA
ncbi:MAG: GNAT family N-acetyltransferase [Hyphomicrobiales bacterium]|nr:GNAT family N-acetyltransferase [Hyphomicrobiales bacterium]